MENEYLHVFQLVVDGLPDPVEFEMFHDSDDVTTVTDAFAKYVARQEDDFLPLGPGAAVRADRVVKIEHLRVSRPS